MARALTSQRYRVRDFNDAVELYFRKGWTDGLPVVPPTEDRVVEFLEYAGLDPDQVIGQVPERARDITAEKLAINAVMAGCLPEYMPVLVAAVEAVTDAQYKFNHLASLGSPWPFIIVNGPKAKEIGLNSGMYLFGPGSRPNVTIARAVSLLLANCAEARSGGVQRGQWGNPMRWCGCIAENEDTAWPPLQVQLGFTRNDSTVTVVSVYPGTPLHLMTTGSRPSLVLDAVCQSLPRCGGSQWIVGTYVVLIGPQQVEEFAREGWSKREVRQYLLDNTKASIADLKANGAWGVRAEDFGEKMLELQPGDRDKYVYLFKDNGEYQQCLVSKSSMEGRTLEVFIVVAGGDAGHRIAIAPPYGSSTNPVTKVIRSGG